MNRDTCCECGRPSTYDSPAGYCDLHWLLWFTQGWEEDGPPNRIRKYRYNQLRSMWRRHGRPKDWKKMLEELKAFGKPRIWTAEDEARAAARVDPAKEFLDTVSEE